VVNKPKKIGTKAEMDVLKYAIGHGFPGAKRNPPAGSHDVGDLCLAANLVTEVKADKSLDYPQFMRETEAERTRANAAVGICVIKPPGVGDRRMNLWWMLMASGTYDALEFLAGSKNFMASFLTQSETVTLEGRRPAKFKPGDLLAQKSEHLRMMPGTTLKPGAARVSRTGWDFRFLYLPDALELLRWAGFGEPMTGTAPLTRGPAPDRIMFDEPVNWGNQ
jgi:hypothetical protein